MAPLNKPSRPSPHWIYSDKAHQNIAFDRDSFGENYMPFRSSIQYTWNGKRLKVIGIGSVTLWTQRQPQKKVYAPLNHAGISVRHVLHVPDAPCNILGLPFLEDRTAEDCTMDGVDYIIFREGCPLAPVSCSFQLVDLPGWDFRLPMLKLTEPVYDSQLSSHNRTAARVYSIMQGVNKLPSGEMRRLYKLLIRQHCMGLDLAPQLNCEEKLWLQERYGDETNLLAQYGLTLDDGDDRAAGRNLLRKMMKKMRKKQLRKEETQEERQKRRQRENTKKRNKRARLREAREAQALHEKLHEQHECERNEVMFSDCDSGLDSSMNCDDDGDCVMFSCDDSDLDFDLGQDVEGDSDIEMESSLVTVEPARLVSTPATFSFCG